MSGLESRRRRATADQQRKAARRAADLDGARATQRQQNMRQRVRLIDFLGGECCKCGYRDWRGLVIVQPAGQRAGLHEFYTLMLRDPDLALAELRVLCAICRQIERH